MRTVCDEYFRETSKLPQSGALNSFCSLSNYGMIPRAGNLASDNFGFASYHNLTIPTFNPRRRRGYLSESDALLSLPPQSSRIAHDFASIAHGLYI